MCSYSSLSSSHVGLSHKLLLTTVMCHGVPAPSNQPTRHWSVNKGISSGPWSQIHSAIVCISQNRKTQQNAKIMGMLKVSPESQTQTTLKSAGLCKGMAVLKSRCLCLNSNPSHSTTLGMNNPESTLSMSSSTPTPLQFPKPKPPANTTPSQELKPTRRKRIPIRNPVQVFTSRTEINQISCCLPPWAGRQ